MPKSTVPDIREHKGAIGSKRLVMITAYDAPGARMVDEAGADMILVGDSLAMVVLGYEDTLQVTVEDIAHHTAAVSRTKPEALIVADLPWLSYHISIEETVKNAAKLIRAGANAIKLEGGRRRIPMIEALLSAEIPVMGHIGLLPQTAKKFKVTKNELLDYFEKELNTKYGSGFSIQPKFSQSAYFRFHNKSELYDGLFFVGAGTHPGAGVPGVLSSAKVLDKII